MAKRSDIFDKIPVEAKAWLNQELAEKLKAIRGKEAAKKRYTIIAIAFAEARQESITQLLKTDRRTCAQSIWYDKWRHDPLVKDALEAATQRALDYADECTIAIEAHYQRIRRQRTAEKSADVPLTLAEIMDDKQQRGADRISAANSLMGWAEPDNAAKVRPATPASSFEQTITQGIDLSGLSDEELDKQIERQLQAGYREPAGGMGETPPAEIAADDPGGETAEAADA